MHVCVHARMVYAANLLVVSSLIRVYCLITTCINNHSCWTPVFQSYMLRDNVTVFCYLRDICAVYMFPVENGSLSLSLSLSLSQVLFISLEKLQTIPENSGLVRACATFSNPFAQSFELTAQSGFNVSGPAGMSVHLLCATSTLYYQWTLKLHLT